MSLKLIILGKAGLQVLTDIFKVNQYFKKKKKMITASGPITSRK